MKEIDQSYLIIQPQSDAKCKTVHALDKSNQ